MPRPIDSKSTEPKDRHELYDIQVREVSIVDAPANMRKFLLLKNVGNRTVGAAITSLLDVPLAMDGELLFPPDLTVGQLREFNEELKADRLNKAFSEASAEDKLQFLEELQAMHWAANYHLLSKADKLEVEAIERSITGPFAAVLGAIRAVKTAVQEEEEMLAKREAENFRRFFVTPAPVHKAAPANGQVTPNITLNVTVSNTPVKKDVIFKRDEAGHIIGAELKSLDAPASTT